ncbi:MAG: SH3 domain-containing protein [Proteobacteria bacterium]|nr:SH3 domain-containing protein [Pseudomonadota bacterium]MBU4582129.1 SH3 domain-containing protein [Pseudomonadota bacterium]MCG2739439.1 SH3 domain-containing protein [Syntrophaceae bacterium]
MNSMNESRLSYAVLLVILCAFALQGCMAFAVAPLATSVMVAAGAGQGFLVYKTFQTTTGGSLKVKFKDVTVSESDREVFKKIKRLAVLPGSGANIRITEKLIQKNTCEVVTPAQVTKLLLADKALPFDALSNQLTETERIERLKHWAAKLNADAVLVYEQTGGAAGGSDINLWSFKRAEMKDKIVVKIFSSKTGRFILDQPGEVVWELGSKSPSQEEIQELVATSVADKLMDYLKNPISPKTETASTSPSILAPKEDQAASPPPAVLTPKEVPVPSPPSPSPSGKSLVCIKRANVRAEANDKSKVIATLKNGEKVDDLGKSGNWYNIKLSSGLTGWVFKDLVNEIK